MDETLDKYLKGELDEDEKTALEARLKQDPKLYDEYILQKALQEGVKSYGREKMKGHLHALEQGEHPKFYWAKKVKHENWYQYMGWAAAVLIVVAASVLLLNQPTETIFDRYYEPYPNYEADIQRGASPDDYAAAFIAYERADYKEAKDRLKSLLVDDPDNAAINFYLASAYLASDEADSALQHFETVRQQPDSPYFEQAYWYLALANLKLEREEEARKYLKYLVGHQGYSSDEASEILGDIQ